MGGVVSNTAARLEDWRLKLATNEATGTERSAAPPALPPPPSPPVTVTLHVYHLGGASEEDLVVRLNGILRDWGTGIYHCGVEIHGREWSYGSSPDGETGMFHCRPRQSSLHKYLDSIAMGEVRLSSESYWELISSLADDWNGADYHLLRRNCMHFCQALLEELGLGPMPKWIMSSIAATQQLARMQDGFISALDTLGIPTSTDTKALENEAKTNKRQRSKQVDDHLRKGVLGLNHAEKNEKQASDVTFVVNFGSKRMSVAV